MLGSMVPFGKYQCPRAPLPQVYSRRQQAGKSVRQRSDSRDSPMLSKSTKLWFGMIAPFKTRTAVGQNVKVFSCNDKLYYIATVNIHSQPWVPHRLTSWRWCCLSDSGTEWSSDSSAGNCCHLNGVAGRGYQGCCNVGSLTVASSRHRNTHWTATTCAVAHCVSCNVTVAINAQDTAPSNEDANRVRSHGSDLHGWISRGWGLEKVQLVVIYKNSAACESNMKTCLNACVHHEITVHVHMDSRLAKKSCQLTVISLYYWNGLLDWPFLQ